MPRFRTARWAISRRRDDLTTFFLAPPSRSRPWLLLDVHLAQPGVLGLQLLHARHQRYVHAAVLGAPLVERGRADDQLPAQLRNGKASLHALDRFNDLAICRSRLLHAVELLNEKILLLTSSLLLRENPSKAAVLEEFLHETQARLGIVDRLGTCGLGSAETHVKDFMMRHQNMLGLSVEDVRILNILRDKGL